MEGSTIKRSGTNVTAKLPPVALGGEMHGQIKDQEKQIVKLSETVKALQQELILAKKAQGASGGDDDLKRKLEELRSENSGLVVWLWLT